MYGVSSLSTPVFNPPTDWHDSYEPNNIERGIELNQKLICFHMVKKSTSNLFPRGMPRRFVAKNFTMRRETLNCYCVTRPLE